MCKHTLARDMRLHTLPRAIALSTLARLLLVAASVFARIFMLMFVHKYASRNLCTRARATVTIRVCVCVGSARWTGRRRRLLTHTFDMKWMC